MDPQDPNLDPAAAWGGQAGAQPAQPPAAAAAAPPQAQQPITMNATDLLQAFYQGLQNMSEVHDRNTQALQMAQRQAIDNLVERLSATIIGNTTAAPVPQASQQQNPPEHQSRVPSIQVRKPRTFNGKADQVLPFIRDIRSSIELQQDSFRTDRQKAIYLGMFLADGSPTSWFNAIEVDEDRHWLLYDFEALLKDFRAHFINVDLTQKSLRDLEDLRQTQSVAAYASRFRELRVYVDISSRTEINMFRCGLKDNIKDILSSQPSVPDEDIDKFIAFCIRIDERQHERELERRHERAQGRSQSSYPPRHRDDNRRSNNQSRPSQPAPAAPALTTNASSSSSQEVPMEIDAVRHRGPLSPEEKERRRKLGLCLYCGIEGHLRANCPNMSEQAKQKLKRSNPSSAAPSSGKA